jgi:hypothetical protein
MSADIPWDGASVRKYLPHWAAVQRGQVRRADRSLAAFGNCALIARIGRTHPTIAG